MGDIVDPFSVVSRVKSTIVKSFVASFSTASTTFVDVTGSSISVPNNWYYAFLGSLSVNSGTTATWQLLEGASVKDTATATGTGGVIIDQHKIYQNTSGSTQTVKMQEKTNGLGGVPTVGFTNLSIIASPLPILYNQPLGVVGTTSAWIQSRRIFLQMKAYINSIDVLIASATGLTTPDLTCEYVIQVSDSQTTPQTAIINRLVDQIAFIGTDTNNTGNGIYIAYDWTGNQVIV